MAIYPCNSKREMRGVLPDDAGRVGRMNNIFIPMQLRCARQRKRLTLKSVSVELKISLSFLSDIERGRTLPSIKTLITLCDYYDLHIDDVFVYVCEEEN